MIEVILNMHVLTPWCVGVLDEIKRWRGGFSSFASTYVWCLRNPVKERQSTFLRSPYFGGGVLKAGTVKFTHGGTSYGVYVR